jgi:hypothetical protein
MAPRKPQFLLDKNVPVGLLPLFRLHGYDCSTIQALGWNRFKDKEIGEKMYFLLVPRFHFFLNESHHFPAVLIHIIGKITVDNRVLRSKVEMPWKRRNWLPIQMRNIVMAIHVIVNMATLPMKCPSLANIR